MNRREFLKLSAAAAAAALVPVPFHLLQGMAEAGSQPLDLAVVRGGDPRAITRAAIQALGGMQTFISKGDSVVVKPNMAWDRTPEQAANSNPEVVAEVVKMCFEAGAKKVSVFDRPVNDPRRSYVQSGLEAAAKAEGANVTFMDNRRFKDSAVNGKILKEWPVYEDILTADKIINIPIAKHHGLARITMGIKNWMGVIGGNRSRIHQNIDQALADLAAHITPTLVVLDAVRILTDNGPQGGDLADVRRMNLVVAGRDQVAVDAYGTTLFGKEPAFLGYLTEAASRGTGRIDIENLAIQKFAV